MNMGFPRLTSFTWGKNQEQEDLSHLTGIKKKRSNKKEYTNKK